MSRLPIVLALLGLTVGVARAEPTRRRVHVDHVAPAKVEQYVTARAAWVAWIAAHHAIDPWGGMILQLDTTTFLTLRAFATYAELDPPAAPPAVPLDPEAQRAYNTRSDDALVPPHHNEIWVRTPDLDYQPPGAPIREGTGVGRAELATVALDDVDETAWAEIRAALTKARYPLARVTYASTYGSGKQIALWLAPTRAAFAAAPALDDVLARQLGAARATALLARWRGATLTREVHDVVARPDLSN